MAPKKTTTKIMSEEEFESLVRQRLEIRKKMVELGEEIDVINGALIMNMKKAKITKLEFPRLPSVTLVEGKKTVLDEDRLKKSLGATVFNKLCTLMLDKKKLEASVTLGEVPANVVAECTNLVDIAPYLR